MLLDKNNNNNFAFSGKRMKKGVKGHILLWPRPEHLLYVICECRWIIVMSAMVHCKIYRQWKHLDCNLKPLLLMKWIILKNYTMILLQSWTVLLELSAENKTSTLTSLDLS